MFVLILGGTLTFAGAVMCCETMFCGIIDVVIITGLCFAMNVLVGVANTLNCTAIGRC